ncbi:hypothetical protein N2152v2_008109 [Parachlorella kessleri]
MAARTFSPAARALLALCVLFSSCHVCRGHGYLAEPASRNYLANSDYCPHCLNADGPAAVAGDFSAQWPRGRGGHGLCGDPEAQVPHHHEVGGVHATGKIAGTYTEGQVVQFEIVITAFHMGRFGFRICRIQGLDTASEKAQFSEDCLNQHQLVQASVSGAQNPGDLWFHLGQENRGTSCVDCTLAGTRHVSYYQLPPGLTCDGASAKCILQWYWLTGNSCNPPGEGYPWGNGNLEPCGQGPYPEEFWNCADILIMPRSGSTPLPSPSPSPAPLPSPSPGADNPSPSPSPSTILPSPSPPRVTLPSPVPGSSPSPRPPSPSPGSPPPVVPNPPVVVARPPVEPGDADGFCAWVKQDGFFPDLSDISRCRNYYVCSQGKRATYGTCPLLPMDHTLALKWNYKIHACDFPQNVDCPQYGVPPASPPPPSPQPAPPTVPCAQGDAVCFCKRVASTDGGVFPDTDHGCGGFFQCALAEPQYVPCAPGTSFSAALGYCDWSQNVLCPIITSFVPLRVRVSIASQGVRGGLPSGGLVPLIQSEPGPPGRRRLLA